MKVTLTVDRVGEEFINIFNRTFDYLSVDAKAEPFELFKNGINAGKPSSVLLTGEVADIRNAAIVAQVAFPSEIMMVTVAKIGILLDAACRKAGEDRPPEEA